MRGVIVRLFVNIFTYYINTILITFCSLEVNVFGEQHYTIRRVLMYPVKLILLFIIAFMFSVGCVGAQTDKLTINPYGFLKFDMAYDRAQTNNGNYVFWVNTNPENDDEFNMTARQTNLGATISYEGQQGRKVSARFEFDFYGGGDENKNMPMLRHGYLKVDFNKYYLIAGQNSDIISPLVPMTLNYTVLWNCGNIGYRRPQIQIGNAVTRGIEIIGSLSRNISGDFDHDNNDDGEESPVPTVQMRVSYKNQKMNVGVSGHYGKNEYTNKSGKDDRYVSQSFNVHASYSFTPQLSMKGEFFTGKTLNQYLGGIGQGFDIENEKEIESAGGWFNATLAPTGSTSFNVGIGVDRPADDDTVLLERKKNMCVFGNVYTKIAHKTTLAFEISRWTTRYRENNNLNTEKSNLRVQTSLILNL